MKKLIPAVVAAGLAIGSSVAQADSGSRLHQILESGKLRMGVTLDWNPMSFRNPENNEMVGFDIDWGTQLAKDMGVEIEFVKTEWKTLLAGIVSDKYDISNSASLTPSRAKSVGFTDHYYELGTVPLALTKNHSKYPTWESINNPEVTVASTMGTVQEQQAKQYFPNAQHRVIEAPARDYQEVLVGRADVHITSNVEAVTLNQKFPELMALPVTGRTNRPLGALLPQNDQIWINFVNHWIKAKKVAGFFDSLEAKWLVPEMEGLMKD